MAMRRTHIMLSDRQLSLLRDESGRTDVSVGELIRRAVDKVYRPRARLAFRGYEVAFSVWKRPDAAVVGRRVRTKL
jgi:hypothetical protein